MKQESCHFSGGRFKAFMCVNIFKFLVLPLLGFATCLVLFISLSSNAKIAGSIWLLIGVIYLAATTSFFRRTPKILEM